MHESKNGIILHRSPVPLYQQIYEQLRNQIETGELARGATLPTSQELGAQLHVNAKTAHMAMSILAREGYVTRQSRRGTVVNGIPRRGVTAIFSYFALLELPGQLESYRLLSTGLSQQLESIGRVHRMYLGSESPTSSNTASEDLLRHLEGGTLCGVFLLNAPQQFDEIVECGRKKRVPVISLSGARPVDYSVRVDFREFVRVAARRLKDRGRDHVGVIYNSESSAFKEPGIIQSIWQECGLKFRSAWAVGLPATEANGYRAAADLPLDELDGLVVEDDLMAIGVDHRLHGLAVDVPGRIDIVTLWNRGSRLCLRLPMDRVEVNVEQQVRLGLQLMESAINGAKIDLPHLVIRPE